MRLYSSLSVEARLLLLTACTAIVVTGLMTLMVLGGAGRFSSPDGLCSVTECHDMKMWYKNANTYMAEMTLRLAASPHLVDTPVVELGPCSGKPLTMECSIQEDGRTVGRNAPPERTWIYVLLPVLLVFVVGVFFAYDHLLRQIEGSLWLKYHWIWVPLGYGTAIVLGLLGVGIGVAGIFITEAEYKCPLACVDIHIGKMAYQQRTVTNHYLDRADRLQPMAAVWIEEMPRDNDDVDLSHVRILPMTKRAANSSSCPLTHACYGWSKWELYPAPAPERSWTVIGMLLYALGGIWLCGKTHALQVAASKKEKEQQQQQLIPMTVKEEDGSASTSSDASDADATATA